MSNSDFAPGTKVRCIFKGNCYGKTGVIEKVTSLFGNSNNYVLDIKWDWNDDYVFNRSWYLIWDDSYTFELIRDEPEESKACNKCGCYNKIDVQSCWYCNLNANQ